MRKVQLDDVIRVHYTGKLEDGTEFDSSIGKDPIEFKVGDGHLIPGFEKGVVDMEEGEKKTISIPAKDAYGESREELTTNVKKSEFPPDISPTVGMTLQVKGPNDQVIPVIVIDISEDTVTLDANPPLAGQTLIFDLEMVCFV